MRGTIDGFDVIQAARSRASSRSDSSPGIYAGVCFPLFGSQGFDQRIELNRFYQVVVEPGVSRAFAILLLAVTGDGNETHMGKLRRLTDEPGIW